MKIYLGSIIKIISSCYNRAHNPYILCCNETGKACLVSMESGRLWCFRSVSIVDSPVGGRGYITEKEMEYIINGHVEANWEWKYCCRNINEYYKFFTTRSDRSD